MDLFHYFTLPIINYPQDHRHKLARAIMPLCTHVAHAFLVPNIPTRYSAGVGGWGCNDPKVLSHISFLTTEICYKLC